MCNGEPICGKRYIFRARGSESNARDGDERDISRAAS
jgi:hypothetical protein